MTRLDRSRVAALLDGERAAFARLHPRSGELFAASERSLFGGVPMSWMRKWPGGFPVVVADASGARLRDVDGNDYVDLCLGDTGAMGGHAPRATVRAVATQAARGLATMLPSEDAAWVGDELRRRFGLDRWQFTLTATDANRFAIRIARALTGRPRILVFNHCYHGTVDETLATLDGTGRVVARGGNVGPPVDPALTTRVVEFNDVAALEGALAAGDVACVLAEPAMTNIGIVPPLPGFHDALRRLTREHATLLIIDETHTLSAGPGGFTAAHGLEPDMLTIGKAIAGGVPAGALGMRADLERRALADSEADYVDTGGIGGTLAGNPLSLAAMRATLGEVLTEDAYARTIPLAERFCGGVRGVIAELDLPWHVTQLGCRAEYLFAAGTPRTGSEAAAARDQLLEDYLHLAALNRGVLLTPFHNMALMSPATTEADVDRHTAVFRETVRALVSGP
jgi:glutamate-1-semialdehyde 2,1-aminomutase